MKRDKNLLRELLLNIKHEVDMSLFGDDKTAYHVGLLIQAGWIKESEFSNVGELTWEGQEVVDLIKNDEVWNWVKEKGLLEYPFQVILEVLKKQSLTFKIHVSTDTTLVEKQLMRELLSRQKLIGPPY